MNTCKTCKFWVLVEGDEYEEIIFPYKSDREQCKTEEEESLLFGHRVRRCRSTNLLFYERPKINGACVVDAEEIHYYAELLTGEEFGCVNHESVQGEPG